MKKIILALLLFATQVRGDLATPAPVASPIAAGALLLDSGAVNNPNGLGNRYRFCAHTVSTATAVVQIRVEIQDAAGVVVNKIYREVGSLPDDFCPQGSVQMPNGYHLKIFADTAVSSGAVQATLSFDLVGAY